jgi:hypothetical protein
MGQANRYVTGMILAAAIVIFGGFFFLRGAVRTVHNAEFEMSYNMPRPKNALYNFFFGLEGREIDRKEVNPFKEKEGTTKAAGIRKDAPKIPAAAKTAAAQKAAAKAVIAAPAGPKVIVNAATPAAESTRSSGEISENNTQGGANVMTTSYPGAAQAGADADKDKDIMSGAQWRSLVVGQPTKENVMKLVAAFNSKEVDAGTLYLIMGDLMQSSNAETQSQGLLIGQNVPSLKSFAIVSENYDKLDASVKKNADEYLAGYMQSSKLGILAMALQSENSQVVYHAAQAMVTGLTKVKSGQGTVTGGTRLDSVRGVVASSTGKSYSQFVSILQNLVTTGDSSVVPLAQSALTQIQALPNT